MKKKLLYISSIAAPHQLKLSNYLQKYYDTEFWFYDYTGSGRPDWWRMALPDWCSVLKRVFFKGRGYYLCPLLTSKLKILDPDILLLGGFFIPSNYFSYRWARKNGKKVIVFTETFRHKGVLRSKSFFSLIIDLLYRDLDAVFACHEDAAEQMQRVLPTLGTKTFVARYSADIDGYFHHPVRSKREGYRYIFPNRLTEDYNPLLAIEIFADLVKKRPKSKLKINPQGELYHKCVAEIEKKGLGGNVEFLSDIKHWDDLSEIYQNADILLFPARFSNGNFTILECMASGMGIVVSNRIKGQTRLITNGLNGYVCNPDKESFLKAVQEYIDNPDLFITHAAANRELVMPLSGAGTAELYNKLISDL